MTHDFPANGATDEAMTTDCTFYDDNLDAYALGALADDEAARVERHLRRCAPCRRTLASIRRVTSMLPYLVEPADPPATAKATLFARITDQERDDKLDDMPLVLASPWSSMQKSRDSESTSRHVAIANGGSWQRWIAPGLLAPLAILLIVLSAWTNSLQNEVDELRASTTSQVASTQMPNAAPYDMQVYEFKPACKQCKERQASGQLGGDPNGSVGVVVAWNLDPNEKHQVWCIDNQGEKLLVTDLDVEYTGNVFQTVNFPQALSGYQQIYVARHDGTEDPDAELLVAINDQQEVDPPIAHPSETAND